MGLGITKDIHTPRNCPVKAPVRARKPQNEGSNHGSGSSRETSSVSVVSGVSSNAFQIVVNDGRISGASGNSALDMSSISQRRPIDELPKVRHHLPVEDRSNH